MGANIQSPGRGWGGGGLSIWPIFFLNIIIYFMLPGMTGPPNSFTARGPVTLTTILFPQPAV